MGLLQLLKSQFLSHLLICYVFLVSGIIINLLQLCTLPVWLLSKQLFRRINIRLAYCISSREYCSHSQLHRWHWHLFSSCWNEYANVKTLLHACRWIIYPSAPVTRPNSNWSVLYCVLMILRDGSCPRVVVRDRMHALHRPEELPTVWKWKCDCGSQPQLWDRFPVWLDFLWEIWSSWGKSPR